MKRDAIQTFQAPRRLGRATWSTQSAPGAIGAKVPASALDSGSPFKSCFSVAMTPGKTSGGLDLRVLTREGGRVIVTPHQAVMSIKRSKRQAAWWGTFLLSDPILLSSAASSP